MTVAAGRSRPLHWDDVQVFLSVVAHRTVSGAARALGVNHSTVLRRIASLEASLGTRLFDRLPAGYALTASGHDFAERLAGLSEQVDAAQRAVMGLDVEIRGTIRLTSTDTLVHGMLMPLVARFCDKHPGVQVQLSVNNTLMNLTQREADVAVRGSNRPPQHLVGRRVGCIRTALYASKAYLASADGQHTDVADHRWVAPDEGMAHLDQARWLARHVNPSRIAVRVDSLVGMVEAVAQGAGVGLLLCPLADPRPELVQLAPPEPALDTAIWILTHPDLRDVARIRAFTSFLFDALSQDPRLAQAT